MSDDDVSGAVDVENRMYGVKYRAETVLSVVEKRIRLR